MRAIARKVRQRVARPTPPPAQAQPQLARRIRRLEDRVETLEKQLRARVYEVEEGLQEQRALSQRVAALGDLVAEVVSATARGDRDDLDAALARYADGL